MSPLSRVLIIILSVFIVLVIITMGYILAKNTILNFDYENVAEYIGYYNNWIHYIDAKNKHPYTFKIDGDNIKITYFTKYGMHKGLIYLSGKYRIVNNNTIKVSNWNKTTATWIGQVPQPVGDFTIQMINEKTIKIITDKNTTFYIIRA